MDFIFEDDMDEVGSDIEAYCPKCKQDTSHTVITKYEEEVRRVQCSVCGDVHAFRKPRGEAEEEAPEPTSPAARKRAAAKKMSWQELIDKIGANKANDRSRPYSIRDHYHEGDIVSHPKFGIGFVSEISENKAEVTFQDERRLLVHNRPDLAAMMPAIAPTPAPRDERKKKGKGVAVKGKDDKKAAAKKVEPPKPPAAKPAKPEAKPAPQPAMAKAARAKAAATKKNAAKGKPPMKMKPAKPAGKPAAARKPLRPKASRPARPTVKAKVKAKKAKAR